VKDIDRLLEELEVVRRGLLNGIHEPMPNGTAGEKIVKLPGWANIVGDAMDVIGRLDETRRLRSELRKIKDERKDLQARLTHLRRENYVLQGRRNS
jgi:hypothetical protein